MRALADNVSTSSLCVQVIGVTPAEKAAEPDIIYNGLVNNAAAAAAAEGPAHAVQDPSKLFYGTQMCYIFMRLHHALYVRLRIARQLAAAAAQAARPGTHSALHTSAAAESDNSKPVYNYFLGQVMSMVEGTLDNARFEEFCRTLLGNKSYVLYTLDKLVAQAVKHLQAMANDENVTKLVGLFVYHHHNGSSVDPVVYRDHVACILSHTMEDVFRIQVSRVCDVSSAW
jgi:paired amphipathic helix protein Sin3a